MDNNMPRTPFSTPLSGSAKEVEMRLKNIFSGPKKRPPLLFLAAVFALCVFCGDLVSCDVVEAEVPEGPDTSAQTEGLSHPGSAQPEPEAPNFVPASELSFDINQNGIPEEIRLESEYGRDEVWFCENGEIVYRGETGICVHSYPLGGPDHILKYFAGSDYPGAYSYYYSISDLSGEYIDIFKWNGVRFDINFNAPFHSGFDPETIAAYVEEINELFDHCFRLTVLDGELVAEDAAHEQLDFLDAFPEIFARDPSRSLLENLKDFQAAMTAAYPAPEPLGTMDALPFDRPLEMSFLSGAGAWCTGLTLDPDGSFTGDYHDSDGPIEYVCQFHGRFGDLVQLTGHSWSLTLEELVLDTKYPVGEEWDEVPDWFDGSIHFISSEPAGFTDGENKSLQPGARFILYSPGAKGDKPGTELYGASEFWSWYLGPHDSLSGDGTLDCWGLHNLEAGYGFFS